MNEKTAVELRIEAVKQAVEHYKRHEKRPEDVLALSIVIYEFLSKALPKTPTKTVVECQCLNCRTFYYFCSDKAEVCPSCKNDSYKIIQKVEMEVK